MTYESMPYRGSLNVSNEAAGLGFDTFPYGSFTANQIPTAHSAVRKADCYTEQPLSASQMPHIYLPDQNIGLAGLSSGSDPESEMRVAVVRCNNPHSSLPIVCGWNLVGSEVAQGKGVET